jgi:hypothetical protein
LRRDSVIDVIAQVLKVRCTSPPAVFPTEVIAQNEADLHGVSSIHYILHALTNQFASFHNDFLANPQLNSGLYYVVVTTVLLIIFVDPSFDLVACTCTCVRNAASTSACRDPRNSSAPSTN